MAYEKTMRFLTFRNMLIIGFALSMVLVLFFTGILQATSSTFVWIPLVFCLGEAAFFFVMFKVAKPIVFSETLEGIRNDVYKWASLLYSDIDSIVFERDYIAWTFKGSNTIAGAKILYVKDVKTTYKDLSKAELDRMLRSYEVTMSAGNIRVATFHIRKPIDIESWKSGIRRQRDSKQLDFDVGGPPTRMEEAARLTAMLKRIEEKFEEAYDARFFIVVCAEASDKDDLVNLLNAHSETIRTRFKNDMNMEVVELTDMDLLEAARFFRVQAVLDDSFSTSGRLRPTRVLSYDLAFQNPFVARRLPPIDKMLFGIYIGKIKDSGIPVSWSPSLVPSYHALILGPMGSGKSTLCRTLIYRAVITLGVPCWVVDPAGEYVGLIKKLGGVVIDFRNESINPLILYGRDPVSVANSICEMLTYISGLRGAERFLLRRVILEIYEKYGINPSDPNTWDDSLSNEVTFETVYNYLYARLNTLPSDELYLAKSIINKIEHISIGAYKLGKSSFNLDELFRSKCSVCFDLRGLPDYLQKAIVWTLLLQLYSLSYIRYKIKEELSLLLFIDEAHLFSRPVAADVPGGIIEPPLSMFVRMVRKRGIGTWLATHSPIDLIPPGERTSIMFQALGTIILFGSTDEDYLQFCRTHLHLSSDEVEQMLWMSRGDAMLRYYGDPRAIPIQIIPEPEALAPIEENKWGEEESFEEWAARHLGEVQNE